MNCYFGISKFSRSDLVFPILLFSFISLHCSLRKTFFKISPCYSLEFCIQMGISFSPLPLTSLLFSVICKASSDNHFTFLYFFFLGMALVTASCTMLQTSVHSSSGTLSDLIL
ncbi:unnamed protein product [Rangifer tarandus platyrhynchus]|uniref:Uncharacterized protein n=1 Tax=Rangifer tarandus platyrhynchus TaxID=3082113 RepID=A0AC59ZX01_RANTA